MAEALECPICLTLPEGEVHQCHDLARMMTGLSVAVNATKAALLHKSGTCLHTLRHYCPIQSGVARAAVNLCSWAGSLAAEGQQ